MHLKRDFQNILMQKNAVALCSGIAAINLALINSGVKLRDEIIASTLTF
jgi:dTDP-4-amino-4,6-dideoxygalactose transaminase